MLQKNILVNKIFSRLNFVVLTRIEGYPVISYPFFCIFTGKFVLMFLLIFKGDNKTTESSPSMHVDSYSAKEMLQKCLSQKKRTKAQLYFKVCNVFA